uniref:Uncharacterized protein n=1 Tax=Romanomermis culicivorax TaxID=13658 RepID=A0A915I2R7_ROMCU
MLNKIKRATVPMLLENFDLSKFSKFQESLLKKGTINDPFNLGSKVYVNLVHSGLPNSAHLEQIIQALQHLNDGHDSPSCDAWKNTFI